MKSSAQLKRLLRLVPYLQRHQGISIEEAARRFEVAPRQILTDLEVLQYCGLPEGLYDDLFHVDLEGAREDGSIFFANAAVLNRPMRLSLAEAASLRVALQAVVASAGGSGAADSVMAKLNQLLDDAFVPADVAVTGTSAETIEALQQAISDQQVVRLDYQGTNRRSQPMVEPHRLRTAAGYAYLVAWSRDRQAWRSYRLDRIWGITPSQERFDARDEPGGPEQVWFAEASREVTLTLRPQAAWVAEHHPVKSVVREPDRLEIRLAVGSQRWLAGLLLWLGDDVIAVSDPETVAAAGQLCQDALQRYDALG